MDPGKKMSYRSAAKGRISSATSGLAGIVPDQLSQPRFVSHSFPQPKKAASGALHSAFEKTHLPKAESRKPHRPC
jgi:hypothetical protein